MITGQVISGAVQGLAGIAGGIIGSGARKREQRRAQAEVARMKAQMGNLDTSNLAANMENTYEDLTVNQQASQFAANQNAANLSNTMSSMQGAAGGGGIAALAQSMANASAQQTQQASASIAQQESANQKMAAQGAAQVQQAQIAGATQARGLEFQKTGALMNMANQRLGAANEARANATASIMGGVGALGAAGGAFFDEANK